MMWLINGPRDTLKTNVSTARLILYSTFHCDIGGINNRAMLGNRGFHAVDSGFPVLDTGFFELYSGFQNRGFWIPHVSIWWIPGFHKQTFPGFRSPDSLKWGVSSSCPASSFSVTSGHSSHQDSMRSKRRRLEVRDWGRLIRFEAF